MTAGNSLRRVFICRGCDIIIRFFSSMVLSFPRAYPLRIKDRANTTQQYCFFSPSLIGISGAQICICFLAVELRDVPLIALFHGQSFRSFVSPRFTCSKRTCDTASCVLLLQSEQRPSAGNRRERGDEWSV